MFCPNCGHQLEDGGNFCMECGTNVEELSRLQNAITQEAAPAQNDVSYQAEANMPGQTPVPPTLTAANEQNAAPVATSEASSIQAASSNEKKKSKRVALIVAGVVALLAVVAIAAVLVVQHMEYSRTHTLYAVSVNAFAPGYDQDKDTPIPVRISGTDFEGNDVDELYFLPLGEGEDIGLMRGDYTLSIPASPFLSSQTLYEVPDDVGFRVVEGGEIIAADEEDEDSNADAYGEEDESVGPNENTSGNEDDTADQSSGTESNEDEGSESSSNNGGNAEEEPAQEGSNASVEDGAIQLDFEKMPLEDITDEMIEEAEKLALESGKPAEEVERLKEEVIQARQDRLDEIEALNNQWVEAYDELIAAYSSYEASGFQTYDEELLGGTWITSEARWDPSLAGFGEDIEGAKVIYALYDLNNDNIPELFVGLHTGIGKYDSKTIYEVYTYWEGETVLLVNKGGGREFLQLYPGDFIMGMWAHMGYSSEVYYSSLESGGFKLIELFSYSPYKEVNGEYVETFDDYNNWQYGYRVTDSWKGFDVETETISLQRCLELLEKYPGAGNSLSYMSEEFDGSENNAIELEWNNVR